jgi:hypothetical protein
LQCPGRSYVTLLNQNLRDPAHGDGARAHVAQPLEGGDEVLLEDPQRLIEVAAAIEDVGDPAHGDGARAHVAQPLIDRKLFVLADPSG